MASLRYNRDTGQHYYGPCTIKVNKRMSKTLFTLWKNDYSPQEIGTDEILDAPNLKVSSTQTAVEFELLNKYDGLKYEFRGNILENDKVVITGLRPETSAYDYLNVSIGELKYSKKIDYSTSKISPSIIGGVSTASSIQSLSGSYIEGDAKVISQYFDITGSQQEKDGIKSERNQADIIGLRPNTEYEVCYCVDVAYGDNQTYTYKGTKKIKTQPLALTTQQPKVITSGNVIVAAESNLDDEETNVGFEWRRTDWDDTFASQTGAAILFDGQMEGYIRNMNADKLWKYRAYYLSNSGTYYYGDWVGLDPSNTSYFEPTVHTYAKISVEGNAALVKGYALRGTDNVVVQGFKYWKTVAGAKSREDAPQKVVSIPSNAMTEEVPIVGAGQQQMSANLTGLDYNTTYHIVAFVTTSEHETFYGEEQTFSIGKDPATGIEDVYAETTDQQPATVVARYNMNGQLITMPQKGINIIRMSDGTVKKVWVR